MKILYKFHVSKEQDVDETTVQKDEKGEEVKVTKTVKKQVPVNFFLKKPTRSMYDDAELFYGVQFSQAIKDGLLTRAQLASKFSDEGNTFSKAQLDAYTKSYSDLIKKQEEFQQLSLVKEEERTEEQKAEVEKIIKEIIALRTDIQEFEMNQQSLFDYTAETRARNKTILWWVFQLAYYESGDPIFGVGTYNEKLTKYDTYEDSDDQFMMKVVKQLLYLVSFWYTGKADKQEDFDQLMQVSGLNEV